MSTHNIIIISSRNKKTIYLIPTLNQTYEQQKKKKKKKYNKTTITTHTYNLKLNLVLFEFVHER